jgi:hypothetical protein
MRNRIVEKPARARRAQRGLLSLCVVLFMVLALVLTLASCAMLPRSRIEVSLLEEASLAGDWAVNAIEVDHRTLGEQIRRDLTGILFSAFRAHGLPLLDPAAGGADAECLIDVRLVEREIARDLDVVNAMSMTISIREKAGGRQAAVIQYSEESKDSFASAYHVQAVLDVVLKSLARKRLQVSQAR